MSSRSDAAVSRQRRNRQHLQPYGDGNEQDGLFRGLQRIDAHAHENLAAMLQPDNPPAPNNGRGDGNPQNDYSKSTPLHCIITSHTIFPIPHPSSQENSTVLSTINVSENFLVRRFYSSQFLE